MGLIVTILFFIISIISPTSIIIETLEVKGFNAYMTLYSMNRSYTPNCASPLS